MLIPNNKQKTRLLQTAGVARFAYNWAIAREQNNHNNDRNFLSDCDLRKELTQLKKTDEYNWLNDYSNNAAKQAIRDACDAYLRFFKKQSKFPKFKSKKKSRPSFYVDNVKIKFSETHVKLEKIANSKKQNRAKANWIRLAEHRRIPIDCKYYNPRVTFDGINWWISVGVEYEECVSTQTGEGIGIDVGIKDLAICSDGNIYENVNKTHKIKQLEKKKRRLQRSISRKYENNKEGNRYCKTCNLIKSEKELLKLNHKLTNIRRNYLHQTTTEIVNRKPMFITVEDLNVSGMMKNRHLSKAIQQQSLFEFVRQLQYKCRWNGVELRKVYRFFPSSKLCYNCGCIKTDLKLSDRMYVCDCGYVEDRDFNASLNLRDCTEYQIIA